MDGLFIHHRCVQTLKRPGTGLAERGVTSDAVFEALDEVEEPFGGVMRALNSLSELRGSPRRGEEEDDATDAGIWYKDQDGDSFGHAATSTRACDPPAVGAAESTDRDDLDRAKIPGAAERCDGLDNDRDGVRAARPAPEVDGLVLAAGRDDGAVRAHRQRDGRSLPRKRLGGCACGPAGSG